MRRLSLVAASFVVLAACSSGGSDSPPPPPTTGSLAVVNSTSHVIHEVYVSRSTDVTWGAQRNTGPIASASTFTLSGLEPGLWDAKAVSIGSLSTYYTYAYEQTITAGATTQVTAYDSSFTGTIAVYNGDSYYQYPIVNFRVSPVTSTVWSDDLLPNLQIPYGYTMEVDNVSAGSWDVWCEFSNGLDEYGTVSVSPYAVTNVVCDGN